MVNLTRDRLTFISGQSHLGYVYWCHYLSVWGCPCCWALVNCLCQCSATLSSVLLRDDRREVAVDVCCTTSLEQPWLHFTDHTCGWQSASALAVRTIPAATEAAHLLAPAVFTVVEVGAAIAEPLLMSLKGYSRQISYHRKWKDMRFCQPGVLWWPCSLHAVLQNGSFA